MPEKLSEDNIAFLEKLNRTLEELITYKNIFIATTADLNEKVRSMEKRVAEGIAGMPKDVQIQIEKVETTIERLSKQQESLSKLATETGNLFEGHENILKQIETDRKGDLMYVQGLDRQLHDKEIAIDEKIRDAEKNMAKLEGKIKDTISFQKALKNLIKVVMGGSSEGDL